uniref:Uncharacterized protein n=1 Tax=Erpetoichthys calabaricus TaxID=27687 RepID=A0A8C4XFQ1_ERPCA
MAEKEKSLKEEQIHPYWPRELVIPGYQPNDLSMQEILAGLFLMAGGLILMSWFVSSHCQKFSTARKLVLCWFTVCGFIHGVIEGWFSLFYQIIPTDQSILSQLCESKLHFYFHESQVQNTKKMKRARSNHLGTRHGQYLGTPPLRSITAYKYLGCFHPFVLVKAFYFFMILWPSSIHCSFEFCPQIFSDV